MSLPQIFSTQTETDTSPELVAEHIKRAGMGDLAAVLLHTLRPIQAYSAAREGLARAAETGRAVHTSPGTGGISATSASTASTLAGLTLVEAMARVSAITGAPVQATTNDAVAYALTENALSS